MLAVTKQTGAFLRQAGTITAETLFLIRKVVVSALGLAALVYMIKFFYCTFIALHGPK